MNSPCLPGDIHKAEAEWVCFSAWKISADGLVTQAFFSQLPCLWVLTWGLGCQLISSLKRAQILGGDSGWKQRTWAACKVPLCTCSLS